MRDWRVVAAVAAAALVLACLLVSPRRAERFAGPAPPAYVISVPGTRSRSDVRAVFERAGQPFQFFDGVDGRGVPRMGSLTPGEAGCARSHMALWRALENSPAPVLIFEDDAHLPDDWRARLDAVERAVQAVGAGVDVVFLGHCFEKQGRKRADGLYDSVYPWCTHGYLATPAGLRKLAAWARAAKVTLPIDVELANLIREGRLTGLSCFPPLVATTEGAVSLIGAMKK